MERTIVSMHREQLEALADHCEREGISRAEAIRRAVARYLRECGSGRQEDVFGMWRDRGVDGLEYEDRLRGEWEPREGRH